jgi:hypothetical protein
MGGNCVGIYSIYGMQPSPYIWVTHGMVDPFGGTTTKPSPYLGKHGMVGHFAGTVIKIQK